METLRKLYGGWVALLTILQSPFLLAVRLYWGWGFAETGWGKLQHLAKIADYFQSLGIPFPQANALLASTTEIFGGFFLIIGFGARIVPLPLLFLLEVAYATAEKEAFKAIWTNPDQFTSATPFLFVFACLIVLLFGAGAFSVDAILAKRKKISE